MSQTVDQAADDHAADDHADHPSDAQYVKVFIVLFVVTAIEVGLYYFEIGALTNPALILLAVIKFVLVGLYFMHLKFDTPILRRLFVTGIILALFCYMAVFMMYRLFW